MARSAKSSQTPKTNAPRPIEIDAVIEFIYCDVGKYLYPTIEEFAAAIGSGGIERCKIVAKAWDLHLRKHVMTRKLSDSQTKIRIERLFDIHDNTTDLIDLVSAKADNELRICMADIQNMEAYLKRFKQGTEQSCD